MGYVIGAAVLGVILWKGYGHGKAKGWWGA